MGRPLSLLIHSSVLIGTQTDIALWLLTQVLTYNAMSLLTHKQTGRPLSMLMHKQTDIALPLLYPRHSKNAEGH